MRLFGNWLVAERLVTTALYKLLRLVYITVQRMYWQLNGTAQKLREARLPHNYQRSAQVLDVILWHKFSYLQATTLSNFLYTHNRFEDPQYIIDNEHITLLAVNEHDAVFCEAKEQGRLHFTDQSCPFSPHYTDVISSLSLSLISLSITPLVLSFIQGSNLSFPQIFFHRRLFWYPLD